MANIYVGTYAKYNSGSIQGAWLDPEDYLTKEQFLEACAALHSDEKDPELMFQDWEEIPDEMIGESFVSDDLWDWLELDDSDRELLAVYRDNVDSSGTIEQAQEAYAGTFNDEADWAENWWEDSGMLSEVPDSARGYINYEAYARDCRLGGDMHFVHHEGKCWAFHNR